MNRLLVLFALVGLGLLVLLGSWWQQRYQAETERLEERISGWVNEQRNNAIFAQLEQLDKLEDFVTINDTITHDVLNTPFPKRFQTLDWMRTASADNEDCCPEETQIYTEQRSSAVVKIRFDSLHATTDTNILVTLNLNDFVDNEWDSIDTGLVSFSDSLGLDLSIIELEPKQTTSNADTLGEWYLPINSFTISTSSTASNSYFKTKPNRFVLIEGYQPYYLSKLWREWVLGIALIIGVIALYSFARRDLKRQEKQLEQKDRFIANIAHELKTPIATVGVALEALENFGAAAHPERRQEYLSIGRQELDRLSLLADRALNTMQLDAGKLSIRPETVTLEALVERAWASLALKHGLSENQLKQSRSNSSSSTANEPASLEGDPELLLHLIYNLLDNACKYGGEPPQIELHFTQSPTWVSLSVADNGPGVAVEDQERIFEKFYRSKHANGHRVKGHGLGLSYVKQIAKAHGGHISLANQKTGQGAVFTLRLPRQHD